MSLGQRTPDEAALREGTRLDVAHGLAELRAEWDGLCDRLSSSPFARPGWMAAWWESFGRGELRLLCARRETRLVGILPVEVQGSTVASLANSETPLGEAPVEDPDAWTVVMGALLAGPPRPRRARVSRIDPAAAAAAALRLRASDAGFCLIESPPKRSLYVDVDGDWAAYQSRREAKLLANIRRRRRLLEREGPVHLDVWSGGGDLDALLDEGFAVEAAGWKGEAGTAISSSPETESFYRRVAEWAAQRGSLRLAFLRVGERALAFDYCLEEAGVHYLLKTGYDPAFRRCAPGIILRYEMLSRAFSLGLRRYEFLGSDYEWKRPWAGDARRLATLEAFAPTPRGYLSWTAQARLRPAARRLLRR